MIKDLVIIGLQGGAVSTILSSDTNCFIISNFRKQVG